MEADVVEMFGKKGEGDAAVSAAAVEHLAYLLKLAQREVDQERRTRDWILGKVQDLERRLGAMEAANKTLREDCAGLRQEVTDLDTRFTNVAGLVSAQKHPGKQTESDARHHDVGRMYEQFISQDMYTIVRSLPPDGQAEVLCQMSVALFASERAAPDELRLALHARQIECTDAEIRQVCLKAQRLREEAHSLGRKQKWDFAFERGGPVNPIRQERVAGSAIGSPDEVVDFVVTPGYVVGDGYVVKPQRVFTVVPRCPQPGPAPGTQDGSGQ